MTHKNLVTQLNQENDNCGIFCAMQCDVYSNFQEFINGKAIIVA